MSKARILADLISDSQITASEITGLELNAIQQGDTIVEVSDTGSGGKVVVRVDGADNAEFNAGGIKVPSGTTAQRDPAAVVGSLRYNTTTGFFETFTGSGWGAVATPPSITGINPNNFNGEAGATFTVNGAFFDSSTTAVFTGSDGTEYAAATVTFVNSSQITITNATNLPVANEPFKVKVTNGAGLSIESTTTIDAGSVPSFTTAAGNIATTTRWDDAVSVTVAATDAENTISGYAITQGNLPAGLALNTTTGAITGTSTEQTTTTYTFTIEATDSVGNTNTRQFNIQIVNAAPTWSSPAEGGTEELEIDASGSITLNATDPEGEAVSYTSGPLPTGLSLSGNVISGTPTVEATTGVAVTASDGYASVVRNFFINVAPPYLLSNNVNFIFFSNATGVTESIAGRTLAQLQAAIGNSTHYSQVNSGLSLAVSQAGYTEFTAPYTGTYRFTVAGARGGGEDESYTTANNQRGGGQGRIVVADVDLVAGSSNTFVIGHRGGSYTGGQGGGGGGGSFLFSGTRSGTLSTLIGAGGGGGGNQNSYSSTSFTVGHMNGQTVTSTGEGGGTGAGTYGNGGSTGSGSEHGASGAGVNSNGTGASQTVSPNGAIILKTGSGIGGPYNSSWGGFGGGSAGWGAAGGGGGYSGGGAKVHSSAGTRAPSGGGGSYIASGVTLISDSGLNYSNSYNDHGYVGIHFTG
jgi:hypothetical protein